MKRDLRAFVTLFSGLVPMLVAQRSNADEPGWEQVHEGEPAQPPPPALPPPAALPPPPLPSEQAPAFAGAGAPPAAEATTTSEESTPGRPIAPREVDIRAGLNTDPFLHYIGLSASADVGIVRAGPGTIAVGGGIEHDFCGSTCWTFSGATPMDFGHRQIWPQARASYHLGFRGMKNVDFYPLVSLGPVFARGTVEVAGSRYTASDTTIGVGMGAGASWFIDKRWFVGAEARIRYAAGTYDYALSSGSPRTFDRGAAERWSLNGLDATFTVGVRLP